MKLPDPQAGSRTRTARRRSRKAFSSPSGFFSARTRAEKNPEGLLNAFLERLRAVRVLDPACGSGNFLYLALQALKDLEREAILWGSLTLQSTMQLLSLIHI